MHSTQVSASIGAWVPQLQTVLQEQLAQVGEQFPAFNDLQIHCAVEGGRLQIAVDLRSPIELDSQTIFWALEEFGLDCAPELPLADVSPARPTHQSLGRLRPSRSLCEWGHRVLFLRPGTRRTFLANT